jgi:hypothetical protein
METPMRPTKYNVAGVAAILQSLRHGATREAAATAAGISYKTYATWQKDESLIVPGGIRFRPRGVIRNEDGIEPWRPSPDEPWRPLTEGDWVDYSGSRFCDATLRARDEQEAYLIRQVELAATIAARVTYHYGQGGRLLRKVEETDWRAAAWQLEHHPDYRRRFGPKAVELSGPNGGSVRTEGVTIVTWEPDAEWIRKYAQALAESGILEAESAKT